ncbi:hypothetical protein ASPZODRAFT_152819 [Penicilliopsis zonata CBS 506.65]|uniref:FAD/NAD(P)-binding domain-containing protein n=1 Tax=Penicilliopsis zonata CBS 506.65 TaxID=1073090 RepID=A0A1L9SF70_9EURO|nr:hypothetical protein ASPZODRAFT_152819 [Penicilliopsis zonata CBS 506.65]OJJ45841.1 hypothetical protein ASPZODRAFT_152819 [Penicilliopsis zonata CBS 506.65]
MALSTIYDALIVGGGPAGLAAALGLARVNRSALLFDSGVYRNTGAEAMHTFLTRDGTNPGEFRRLARGQLEGNPKYSHVAFRDRRVITVSKTVIESTTTTTTTTTPVQSLINDDNTCPATGYVGFQVMDETNQIYTGRKLILATGTEDVLPSIEGYSENWPEHIYQCPFCDGLEQKESPIGVLFEDASYTHLAFMAINFNPAVTLFTNGPLAATDPAVQKGVNTVLAVKGTKLDQRRIVRFVNNGPGHENGISVHFEDGPAVTLGMILHRAPTRNRAQALFDQLGLNLKDLPSAEAQVDPLFGESSLPGCFVAGDTMEGIKQVAFAQASGVRAASGANFQLINEEIAKMSK